MPNIALVPSAATRIAPLVGIVDGFPEEVHKLEAQTSSEPVERGPGKAQQRDVTDHAVNRQEKLTLTGWVSDFAGGERPAQAWEAIRRLHKSLTPLDAITEWGTYRSMLISRVEATKTGRGLRFTMELEEVRIVGVVDSELPASNLSGPAAGRSGVVERGRVALPPMPS